MLYRFNIINLTLVLCHYEMKDNILEQFQHTFNNTVKNIKMITLLNFHNLK